MALELVEIPELKVYLDRLVYEHAEKDYSAESQHVFIYFLTITNNSNLTVKLLARKWIIEYEDGSTQVIEGEGIVGQTPTLAPTESFSYNSFHVTNQNALAMGSFFGLDNNGLAIFARVPPMHLILPPF